jgi:hypothetical protein
MAQQEFPDVRGFATSWAEVSAAFTIDQGATLSPRGIKEVNWSDTVEVGEERGLSGGAVQARTTGQYSCEASLVMYQSGWLELQNAIAAVAPTQAGVKQLSIPTFDLLVKYERRDQPDTIHRVKLKGCRILGRSGANSEGVDPTMREVTLNPVKIVEVDSSGNEVSLL